MKRALFLLLASAILLLALPAGAATVKEILPADVHAATTYGADIDTQDFIGPATFMFSAEAQGSGKTETMILQDSGEQSIGSLSQSTAGDSWITLRDGTASNTELSAEFVQSGARQLKSVWVYLKRLGTIATGSVYVKLEADTGGLPDGTALTTSTAVSASSVSTTGDWTQFTFATPYDLTTTETYHVVLYGSYSVSGTANIKWYSTAATAGNGEICDAGAWANAATVDFCALTMQYNFSAVTGGTFTAVGDAASFQTKDINMDGVKRYIRVKNTVSGGSATGATCVIMVGKKQYEP